MLQKLIQKHAKDIQEGAGKVRHEAVSRVFPFLFSRKGESIAAETIR